MRIYFIEFECRGRLVRAKCFVEVSRFYDHVFVCSVKQNKIFRFLVDKRYWYRPIQGCEWDLPADIRDEIVRAVRRLSVNIEREPDPAA